MTDDIKTLLLRTPHASGTYVTPIPGLTLLCGDKGCQAVANASRCSVVVIVQGKAHRAGHNAHILYAEHGAFTTTPHAKRLQPCSAPGAAHPFLAFSLKISRYILSLLHQDASCASLLNKGGVNSAASDETIRRDLLQCFGRLISLLNKPEQIAIRAPIIICEIHYLLVLSKQWHCFAPSDRRCRRCGSSKLLSSASCRRRTLTERIAPRHGEYMSKEYDLHPPETR